jgi:hypothetical protein
MRRPTYADLVATTALVIVVGGGTFAIAAPSGSGTIRGCSDKRTGVLRVLSGSKKCKRTERALSWNTKGSPGADGLAGAAGPGGTAGANGKDGGTGPIGPTGPTGPSGSPDTGSQILTKLAPVDGAGSSLDADTLDGFDGASFGREIAVQDVATTFSVASSACTATTSSVPAGVLDSDYMVADFASLPSGVIAMPFGLSSVVFPAPDVVAVIRICNINAGPLSGSPVSYRLHFLR